MTHTELIKKRGYYAEVINKLGNFGISKKVTISRLKPSRGVVQQAYKEINDTKFEGDLIDYFCWISTLYFIVNSFYAVLLLEHDKKIIEKWVKMCTSSDLINMLRLTIKNKEYYTKGCLEVFENLSKSEKIIAKDKKYFLKSMEKFLSSLISHTVPALIEVGLLTK